ncbi:MAG: hypothetical protein L6Q54_13645 [Leptospiraceae bacterium]|nr:glycosyltransferase family 39 protein [Leptospiraceae bacterium]MCK6382278.1 hypothetical protein [Leptospiraceae bacterium]NUM41720.1 glycosyltransferase family 39 protein [Leptospiraceae bacterium]
MFFSPAHEFYLTGILKTEVLRGLIPGMEKVTLWMPPVYMLYLSGVFHFFSPDIFIARMASSLAALGSAFLLYTFLGQWKISQKKRILIFVLVLTDFLFIKTTHSSRMESLCLFFALGGLNILGKYISEKSFLGMILAGVFFSFSFLSHPFGAVYGVVSLYFLYEKNFFQLKSLIFLLVGFLLPLLVWASYIIPYYDLFLLQFGAQFSRKSELFSTFSQITKIKIIVSSFRFPFVRLFLFFVLGLGLFLYRKNLKSENNGLFQFAVFWLLSILLFLYISSESWYVVYIIPPVAILTGLFFGKKEIIPKGIVFLSIGLNIFILVWVVIQNFIIIDTPKKTNEFYSLIENEIINKNKIYIQSIPDPYFYLKKKFPEKTYLEFIPGELSLPPEYYLDTIKKQEAFLFYNEDLINPNIKKYLSENPNHFERKVIQVDTGNEKELKLETFLYIRK